MTEEQRAASLEKLKRETTGLPTAKELAWQELKNGVRPEWVAVKYGFPLETMQAAKAELERRQSKRRAQSAGTSDRPEGT